MNLSLFERVKLACQWSGLFKSSPAKMKAMMKILGIEADKELQIDENRFDTLNLSLPQQQRPSFRRNYGKQK